MKEPSEILHVVAQWKKKAEEDFKVANALLNLGESAFLGAVCFHAQQAVEKLVKACLVRQRIDFPKTHNLDELVGLLPEDCRPELSLEEEARLSNYAVVTRYPGEYSEISLDAAEDAVDIAKRVRRYFRRILAED